MNRWRIVMAAAALGTAAEAAETPVTPAQVVERARPDEWRVIPADELLVMEIEGGRRIVIQLAPALSPAHVANVRTLASAHWWDGTSINRVQDNYVAQWGDATEKKPLPPGVVTDLPQRYTVASASLRGLVPLPYRDVYAARTGFAGGWPVAIDGGEAWLPHCYGYVGVGRNNSPDAGSGAELYANIGQSPRHLDRNVAVVGRVVAGMEHLSSLPRGSDALGFYAANEHRVPIVSVRLATELPAAVRPRIEVMDTGSRSFADYVRSRASRKDDFYIRPAGAVDLCNVIVPVRPAR